MRTSNKILLGGFIVAILSITGIQITLNAKIKNGDVVILDHKKYRATGRLELPNIKHAVVQGMEECHIWPHDTANLEAPLDWAKQFRYRVVGDTLFIEAGSSNEGYGKDRRSYMAVDLYLPPVESIIALNSKLYVMGAQDTATATSRKFELFSSHLTITGGSNPTEIVYYNKLDVSNSVGSSIAINAGATINDMNVLLSGSSIFEDQGGKFVNITLQTDSTSSASLRAGSLSKLKFIKL